MKLKFLLSLLFLASCTVQEPAKDTLFVVLDSRPQSLDPRKAVSANGMRLIDLIFNSFVKWGDQGGLEPDLALDWKLDNLTWTFKLKPNLKFSNGRLVLKEDILFSFKEFQKKSSPFYSAFKNIQAVEVLRDKETDSKQFIVKIHLKVFQAPFISSDLPVLKILPKQEILTAKRDFNKYPIGTGGWTVLKNDFRQILLKQNSDNKALKRISFNIIRDSLTRTQKMLSKEMDIAPSVIPLDKISQFKRQSADFQVFSAVGFSVTYLLINLNNNFLKDKELRRALSLAVNKEEIIKYKLYGYASPARSFINPKSYFFNKSLKIPEFNLKKAKAIINKLNLKGVEFKLNCSNNAGTVSKARVLASQINKAGLKISLQTNEWGAFYKDIGRGAFDLALMKWVGVVDPDIYRIAFHSANQAPQGRNRSFYKNKEMDQLLDQGFKERDRGKRKQIYDKVQSLTADNFIVIPLWHDQELSIVRTDIEGYKMRANGDFLSLPFVQKR